MAARRRLVWQILPTYWAIILVLMAGVTAYTTHSVRGFYEDQLAADLEVRARLVEDQLRPLFVSGTAEAVQNDVNAVCIRFDRETETRITVILPSGRVIADSQELPASMDNHADRPEIIEALSGRVGRSIRFSHTLNRDLMYVAVPLRDEKGVLAAVRAAVSVTEIRGVLQAIYLKIAAGAMVGFVLAGAISWFVARWITRPIEQMRLGAERFAQGELGQRVAVPNTFEVAGLANALNQMAARLNDRIEAVVKQRNQLEAVLSSMVEGVVAVDGRQRIIRLNDAAARLLGLNVSDAQERSLYSVVRNVGLQQLVERSLTSPEPIEEEVVLSRGDERTIQAHAAMLRDAQGDAIGAVVVLNDVTRLRRLEQVRRDFVANVSHELRTPVTSIKGFVETLLDGALENPDEARRFLGIVANQANRLSSILEDLLTLSRAEQAESEPEIELAQHAVRPVLESAIEVCSPKAVEKGIEIVLECGSELEARLSAELFEQAVVNLLDNAIKYSDPGGHVLLRADKVEAEIAIRVKDNGCGIPSEHLPRLFERFYRVDKARSRKLGGTGLGLSIVKHIVRLHRGRVAVESTLGKGSCFSILLPSGDLPNQSDSI